MYTAMLIVDLQKAFDTVGIQYITLFLIYVNGFPQSSSEGGFYLYEMQQ